MPSAIISKDVVTQIGRTAADLDGLFDRKFAHPGTDGGRAKGLVHGLRHDNQPLFDDRPYGAEPVSAKAMFGIIRNAIAASRDDDLLDAYEKALGLKTTTRLADFQSLHSDIRSAKVLEDIPGVVENAAAAVRNIAELIGTVTEEVNSALDLKSARVALPVPARILKWTYEHAIPMTSWRAADFEKEDRAVPSSDYLYFGVEAQIPPKDAAQARTDYIAQLTELGSSFTALATRMTGLANTIRSDLSAQENDGKTVGATRDTRSLHDRDGAKTAVECV
jgi:hypothetical protein